MDWEKHFAQIGRIAFSFSVLEEIVRMSIRGAFWPQEDLAMMTIERMRFTPRVELLRKICDARLPKEVVAGVDEQLKELIRLAERRNDVIHSVIYPIPENEDVAALRHSVEGFREEVIDIEVLRTLDAALEAACDTMVDLAQLLAKHTRERAHAIALSM